EGEFLRLVHHVDAAAADVELPAVVDAAQPALLVAAEEERGAPVRAILVEQAHPALGIAEGHQVLAQKLDPDRWPVWLRQVPRDQRGDPVPTHGGPHRRVWPDA